MRHALPKLHRTVTKRLRGAARIRIETDRRQFASAGTQILGAGLQARQIEVHGRRYRAPTRPIALICADGLDPAYLDRAFAEGLAPVLSRFAREGMLATARAAMPTFTNPNNLSLVTGAPPSAHGISGNYFLDRETRTESMMLDARFLRGDTIPAALARMGVAVAVVTAKDKLRRALGAGLDGICFSTERADEATLAEHGIAEVEAMVGRPAPNPYSADLSLYVLDVGIELLPARESASTLSLPLRLRSARPRAGRAGGRYFSLATSTRGLERSRRRARSSRSRPITACPTRRDPMGRQTSFSSRTS